MKTDDLIHLIAADAAAPRPNLGLRLAVGVLGGLALSVGLLLAFYGLRPDLGDALLTWRVALKFVVSLLLAATAGALALRLSRPEFQAERAWMTLGFAPLLLLVAVAAELSTTPPGSWVALATGRDPLACVLSVPLMASLPLLGAFWALRDAAPAGPAALGAVAGAMAAGLGAAVYALHCPDDSPLFLMVWYGLASAVAILAGRAGGARLLRW